MTEVILFASLAGLSFLVSVIMFITAIVKKKVNLALWAIVPFFLAGIFGAYTGYVAISKAYDHVTDSMKGRTGDEIYTAVLGKPESCVMVEESIDQVIPRIDAAIYLQARVCPAEVIRLLHAEKYTESGKDAWHSQSTEFPKGFVISTDSVMVYYVQLSDSNGRTLLISPDSTEMLVKDWAD